METPLFWCLHFFSVITSEARDLLFAPLAVSAPPFHRSTVNQNSTCAPSSTTLFGGIAKNSVAERAFRAITTKSFFRQRHMRGTTASSGARRVPGFFSPFAMMIRSRLEPSPSGPPS